LAILLEASYHRHLAGTTDDPFFAQLERGVPDLLAGRGVWPVPDGERVRRLIVDYGGVLTNALQDTMASWTESDGIDPAALERASRVAGLVVRRGGARQPGPRPRTGREEIPHFEAELAKRLTTRDGQPVEAAGLLTRNVRRLPLRAGHARRP